MHRSTNNINAIHRKQIDDFEIRLSNNKHIENELNNEILTLKNVNTKLKFDFDKVIISFCKIKLIYLIKWVSIYFK